MPLNPFESSPSPKKPSPSRTDAARALLGPFGEKMMMDLERRSIIKVTSAPDFMLTEDENVAIKEARIFETLYSSESLRLSEFFGRSFNIPPLPKEITPELKEFWEQNGFKLEYWPKIRMDEKENCPGWEHKPGKRYANRGIEFFDDIQKIQDFPENQNNPNLKNLSPLDLSGAWILKDVRPRPNYKEGRQEYENDGLIQKMLKDLFDQGILNKEASLGLRNFIHPEVFNKSEFWNAFRTLLKLDLVPGAKCRLPRIIEANVMGQGEEFNYQSTEEWCEEYHWSAERMFSGYPDHSSISYINPQAALYIGFRPLVVFS